MNERSPLTTHVLDLSLGRPAAGVVTRLSRWDEKAGGWDEIGSGVTSADGRIEALRERGSRLERGAYRLEFDVRAYFQARGVASFYPRVTVELEVTSPNDHHHVPLLLSPFGYSTYRGS